MRNLEAAEFDCLRKLAESTTDAIPDCAGNILAELESLGLIERVPGVWLPLEMKHTGYRLTGAGRATLDGR